MKLVHSRREHTERRRAVPAEAKLGHVASDLTATGVYVNPPNTRKVTWLRPAQ